MSWKRTVPAFSAMIGSLNGSKNAMVSSAGTTVPSATSSSAPFLTSMCWGWAISSTRFGSSLT